MYDGRTLRYFTLFAPFLVFYRMLLKSLFIHSETGFYEGNPLWYELFAICVAVAVVGIAATAMLTKTPISKVLRGNRVMEVSTFGLGVVLIFTGFVRLVGAQSGGNFMTVGLSPTWLLLFECIFCMISGICLIFVAFFMWSGARARDAAGMLALVPAVWQTLLLVERFVSFRQVLTVSDQLLETLYLLSASLFFLFYARSLLQIKPGSHSLVASALLTALFGYMLALGQYAGMAVVGDMAGPPAALLPMVLSVSSYALLFVYRILRAVPEDSPLR